MIAIFSPGRILPPIFLIFGKWGRLRSSQGGVRQICVQMHLIRKNAKFS